MEMAFKQIVKASLVGILLVPIFFGSLVALSPMVGSNLGVNLVPAAQAATTGCATTGDGDNRASFTSLWAGNNGQNTPSSSRSMTWWFSKSTGWCYQYHFAALNGDGHGWINITGLGQGGAITTRVAGADGDANSVIGGGGALGGSTDVRFVSSTGLSGGGCCGGTVSAETYVQMIGNAGRIIDTQAPGASGYISPSTCLTGGQSFSVANTASGSDPSPSSGIYGYYYYNNGGSASGWTGTNPYPYTAPATTGNYWASTYTLDNANNQSGAYTMNYSVDASTPTGGWISASAANTSSTSVNLSFGASAGGCKGIGNVAITNNQSVGWWYAGYNLTYFGGWDFTNPTYGGNSNQGTHTIYIAFNEGGTGNWAYTSTNVTYDTVGPTESISVPYSNYTNQTSFNTTYSASDGVSGMSSWQLYRQSSPVSGNTCQTGSPSGWTQVITGSGAVNTTYANSSLANTTCYQWALNAYDNASNFSQILTTWLMIDTSPPSFSSFSAPTALVQQHTLTYGFAWSGSTDNASGVISYNLQAQTAPVVSGSCSSTWSNSGSVVNQAGATYSLSTPTDATCYRLGVSPLDRASNGGSSYTYSAAIMIDTAPPVAPPVPVLTVGSDTGSSNHDGLTSIHNGLVFTGTAEAGATVKVYADGSQLLGSGPATAGSYSITTTADLAAGVHTITVTATDVAGNPSSASSAYTVVVHLGCPF